MNHLLTLSLVQTNVGDTTGAESEIEVIRVTDVNGIHADVTFSYHCDEFSASTSNERASQLAGVNGPMHLTSLVAQAIFKNLPQDRDWEFFHSAFFDADGIERQITVDPGVTFA